MRDSSFDHWIDAQLRQVPLPPDLLSRLAQSGPGQSAGQADERLDAALRDVPVPGYLELRLKRIARRRGPAPVWRRMGLAASLLVVATLGAWGYIELITRSVGPLQPAIAERSPPTVPATDMQQMATAPMPAPATLAAVESNRQADDRASNSDVPRLPRLEEVTAIASSWKQALDAKLRSQTALGAYGSLDRLPELNTLEAPTSRGIAPPRVPGYDLLFQLKHAEHPFASPAAHPDLHSTRVPFTLRTASYDLALRDTKAGRLPAVDEIRIEDFLAAVDYLLPAAPTSGLHLYAAGSKSPFSEPNVNLLQLTLQAPALNAKTHPAARLIVAVDTSLRMRFSARAEAIERALEKLAHEMTPADRMMLVGFSEKPRVVARDVTGKEIQTILGSGALGRPTGVADFAAAVQLVSESVGAAPPGQAQRVIFITAGRGGFEDNALAEAKKSLAQIAAAKTPWQIIHVDSTVSDGQFADLAQEGHGQFTAASSSAEIYDALVEKLIGRPSTAARGVTLKLTFNPQVITGYRLLGHEAVTLTGPAADPLEMDFHLDQTVTDMYEIWMKPKGGDLIATAELTWREPYNGQEKRVSQSIRREQFTDSFTQAPPWLQQGIIAAKAAEALRGSYYAPASRPLGQILDLASQVDSRVASQPEFQRLLEMIRRVEKLR